MDKRGFTLVEMMVVVLILSLVTVFLTNYLISERRDHDAYELQLRTRNNVLSALNLISYDLRVLGSDPEFTKGFGIWPQSAGGLFITDHNNILFISDVNADTGLLGDGIWDHKRETFGFYFRPGPPAEPGTLKRPYLTIGGNFVEDSSEALVDGITSLNIWYILSDGTTVPNPMPSDLDDVRACSVEVSGQSARPLPTNNQIYSFTASSRVTLRTRL